MKRIYGSVLLVTLMISVQAFAFSPCLTSTNADHLALGRAVQMAGSRGEGFYTSGTNSNFMGADGNAYISLLEDSGVSGGLISYYAGYGYQPIDFFQVQGNIYSITFIKESCGVVTSQFETSAWTVTQCDSDLDNMPDAWEYETFANLDATADGDNDGDGATNHLEYTAKTRATDPSSTPQRGAYFSYDPLGRLREIIRPK